MTQRDETAVRRDLEPYHERLVNVVHRAHADWTKMRNLMVENDLGRVIYPRTTANIIFDFVAKHALSEFSCDSDVRIIRETQTVKFCFRDQVVVRFKKGDEDNLGQNQPTQAALDFASAQGTLPNIPSSAAKVEILYSETEIADSIDRIVVAARDGDVCLWSYELTSDAEGAAGIPFPAPIGPQDDGDESDQGLVVPRGREEVNAKSKDE